MYTGSFLHRLLHRCGDIKSPARAQSSDTFRRRKVRSEFTCKRHSLHTKSTLGARTVDLHERLAP